MCEICIFSYTISLDLHLGHRHSSISSSVSGTADTIDFDFANKGGEALDNVVINISTGGCTGITVGSMPAGIASAQQQFTGCTGIPDSGTFKGTLTISYTRPGSAIVLTTTGSISGPIK